MDRDGLWARILAVPVLALFLGAGLLFGRIAWDWTAENTQTVIGGGLAICGSSLAVFALIAGLLTGIGLYRKLLDREQRAGAAPPAYPRRPWIEDYREPGPPLLTAPDKMGSWASSGPNSYDIWPEQEEILEGSWREDQAGVREQAGRL